MLVPGFLALPFDCIQDIAALICLPASAVHLYFVPRFDKNLRLTTRQTQTTRARASILTLPHGAVQLPIFMPVATQGSLKGLTPEQLEATSCRLCLNNTYHLGLKPGMDVLKAVGGAHVLQGWKHNILTDSGG